MEVDSLKAGSRVVANWREILLFLVIAVIVFLSLWFTWGKMQLGDSSVELTYGTMVKAGLQPYQDFYLHIMPLTTYLARLVVASKFPIHLAGILGVVNLVMDILVMAFIGKILRLSFFDRVLGFLVFFGVYLVTLVSFNHHSFDVTLSAAVVMFVLLLLKSAERNKNLLFCALAAVCATTVFFITQTFGLAALALGPFVLLLDFVLNKNRSSMQKLVMLVAMEVIVVLIVLTLFGLVGRISMAKMFKATFSTGYEQYTGTYGYGTIWKTAITNVKSFASKQISKNTVNNDTSIVQKSNSLISDSLTKFSPPDTLFNKIFIKKGELLNSIFSLISLLWMVVMTAQLIYVVGKQLAAKQAVDQFVLVWGAIIGIFFASSILVFQLNFSGFFLIFLLWLYVFRQTPLWAQKFLGNPAKAAFGFFGALLLISNLAILHYEFKTRQYYVSKTGNEVVWTSPLIYKDFVNQFNQLASVIAKETSSQQFTAYPRASEIYYLLGKIPPTGFPLVSFFRPGGAYSDTLSIAEKSSVVVIFEPYFWSMDLGEEHRFAMQAIQPTLESDFKLFFSSEYFKAYKHR